MTLKHDPASDVYSLRTTWSRLRGTVDGKAIDDADYPLEMSLLVQHPAKAGKGKPSEIYLALGTDAAGKAAASLGRTTRLRLELPGRTVDITAAKYRSQEATGSQADVALFLLPADLFKQLLDLPKIEASTARCRFRLMPEQLALLEDVGKTIGME